MSKDQTQADATNDKKAKSKKNKNKRYLHPGTQSGEAMYQLVGDGVITKFGHLSIGSTYSYPGAATSPDEVMLKVSSTRSLRISPAETTTHREGDARIVVTLDAQRIKTGSWVRSTFMPA